MKNQMTKSELKIRVNEEALEMREATFCSLTLAECRKEAKKVFEEEYQIINDSYTNKELWQFLVELWILWQRNATDDDDMMSLVDYAQELSGTTLYGYRIEIDYLRESDMGIVFRKVNNY